MGLLANPLASYKANQQYEKVHALFIRDKYDEAEKEAATLLEAYPEHTKTLLLLGLIETNRKHFQAAREWYDKVLDYSDDKEALRGRASSSFHLGNFEDALLDYLTLFERSFSTTTYLTALGKTYHALGLESVSLRYHQKAIKKHPMILKQIWVWHNNFLTYGQYKDARGYTSIAKESYYQNKKQLSSDILDDIKQLEKEIDAGIKLHAKEHKNKK